MVAAGADTVQTPGHLEDLQWSEVYWWVERSGINTTTVVKAEPGPILMSHLYAELYLRLMRGRSCWWWPCAVPASNSNQPTLDTAEGSSQLNWGLSSALSMQLMEEDLTCETISKLKVMLRWTGTFFPQFFSCSGQWKPGVGGKKEH